MKPAQLLEELAKTLVEKPDEVVVTEVPEAPGEYVLELEVAEDDLGRVIGRGGRIANALRSVTRAAAARDGDRILVEILD